MNYVECSQCGMPADVSMKGSMCNAPLYEIMPCGHITPNPHLHMQVCVDLNEGTEDPSIKGIGNCTGIFMEP